MKAIVWTNYGPPDVLQLKEVDKPEPKDNEVLIKVHATTVTAGDCEMRSLKLPLMLSLPMRLYAGFNKPERIKILGQELSGDIEAVGKDVKKFRIGDQIFAQMDFGLGAYAEYRCVPADGMIVLKPENMTYDEAATIPTGGLEALHFTRNADIKKGHKVLINGAGGSIGTYAVQIAKSQGAEVIAVDSKMKFDLLRSIGADKVIDYEKEDFTRNGETYDSIFDVVGKSPFSRSVRSIKNNGVYHIANPRISLVIRSKWAYMTSRKKVTTALGAYKVEDLEYLKDLVEAGKMKSIIDRRYPLERIVEAHRYVESGQKKGNVVINVISRDGG